MNIDWSKQRVLVVAPHPDDEVIGCGGLINRIGTAGGTVYVQFVVVGDTADYSASGFSSAVERREEIEKAMTFLGVSAYHVAIDAEHHLRLDALPRLQLVQPLERESPLSLAAVRPTAVLIPEVTSYNQDHRAVAQAMMTALRPSPDQWRHQPSLVLSYEEPADQWTAAVAGQPNVFIGLTEFDLEAKVQALALYSSQTREHPSSRSEEALRALAVLRGAQCGTPFAEAYRCLRWRL